MNKAFRLQKTKRLCLSKDITAVFNQQNAIRHPMLVLLGRPNGLDYPRIAIIVAKKNVKRANRRNRLKRLIRESFRLHQQRLAGGDYVVLVKKAMDEASNEDIHRCLEKQWARYLSRYNASASH